MHGSLCLEARVAVSGRRRHGCLHRRRQLRSRSLLCCKGPVSLRTLVGLCRSIERPCVTLRRLPQKSQRSSLSRREEEEREASKQQIAYAWSAREWHRQREEARTHLEVDAAPLHLARRSMRKERRADAATHSRRPPIVRHAAQVEPRVGAHAVAQARSRDGL